MSMSRWMVVVLGAVALAGCGGEEAARDFEALATKVCDCKDVECLAKAQGDAQAWLTKHADARGSEAHVKRITDAGAKMAACAQKLTTAAMGGAMSASPADSAE
ncbi:MAG: hypothetical protein IT373_13535 [Polyangiaceae bacterium]|nr:hypothetical protein [Polyangiaceae bacterium]